MTTTQIKPPPAPAAVAVAAAAADPAAAAIAAAAADPAAAAVAAAAADPAAAVAAAAADPATAAVAAAADPEPQIPETRKFTVAEYYRMAEVGILSPEERVQLIAGEIIVMPPASPPHAGTVIRSNRLLGRLAADRFLVCSQTPLHMADGSEPEPDVMLVRPRADCYETAHPTPADVFVVIEVSDSTLEFDRRRKVPLYGRAGIVQTLVLNLPEDCIEDFAEPGPQGYGRHIIHRRGDKIRLVALPDLELAVDDLLPLLPPAAAADVADGDGAGSVTDAAADVTDTAADDRDAAADDTDTAADADTAEGRDG